MATSQSPISPASSSTLSLSASFPISAVLSTSASVSLLSGSSSFKYHYPLSRWLLNLKLVFIKSISAAKASIKCLLLFLVFCVFISIFLLISNLNKLLIKFTSYKIIKDKLGVRIEIIVGIAHGVINL